MGIQQPLGYIVCARLPEAQCEHERGHWIFFTVSHKRSEICREQGIFSENDNLLSYRMLHECGMVVHGSILSLAQSLWSFTCSSSVHWEFLWVFHFPFLPPKNMQIGSIVALNCSQVIWPCCTLHGIQGIHLQPRVAGLVHSRSTVSLIRLKRLLKMIQKNEDSLRLKSSFNIAQTTPANLLQRQVLHRVLF